MILRLSLVARNLPALDLVKAECLQLGAPEVITVKCDVGVEAECEEAVRVTVSAMGGLDILVNNAGYLARENFTSVTSDDIDKSMAVNLKSAVTLSQASLPHLQRSGGNIVNVSSIAGLRAYPGALAYKMSKAAMDQMTRCVALEVWKKIKFLAHLLLCKTSDCRIWSESELCDPRRDRDGHLRPERDDRGGDSGLHGAEQAAPPPGPARAT